MVDTKAPRPRLSAAKRKLASTLASPACTNDRLGEEVAVAVMAKKGRSIDVDALVGHVESRLAKFKVPTIVEVSETPLPRNASGKILKRDIRDELVARRG